MAGNSPLETALAKVRELRVKVSELEQARREPIAITGLGCRLPGGVSNPEAMWRLLTDGVDAVTEVPASRWDNAAYFDPGGQAPGMMAARHGAFMSAPEEFDPYFFGISPREARDIDPQQRIFLEVAWEAVEDAGLTLADLRGSQTGVFVGANACDFLQLQLRRRYEIGTYTSVGGANSLIPNRLSYHFDLRGPSMTIDSACSASLVAVHLAAQSLRAGECETAIVGGMNLMLSPATTLGFDKIGALAPDGRCKTFDARADGYVRGEGVVAIVLKPLSRAVAAGDRIWAVVRGTAVNQDGLTNGVTAPNGISQRDVILAALRNARATPEQISLIEAHGTGTPLGDPIEVEALHEVYGSQPGPPCALGSIKTNIGHLEAGSGIVGLVKAVLCLKYRKVVPSLHFETLNPHIDLDGSRLFVPTETRQWEAPDESRYAAVSAFGAGGTNAHAILAPAPAPAPVPAGAPERVLLSITARTPQALTSMAGAYAGFLSSSSGRDTALPDIAFTAAVRRTQYPHRLALVADSHEHASERLTAWLAEEMPAGVVTGQTAGHGSGASRRRVVFAFAGHGSQRLGMGRRLMERCEVFRDAVSECDEALRQCLGESVISEIHRTDLDTLTDRLTVIQPALFAIGVGLAARWRSFGIEPDAVVGHSLGEITAAHVAGALSLPDAAHLVCLRSELLERLKGTGSLLVIGMPLEQAQELVDSHSDHVSVAVSNSPTSTVLAGDTEDLLEIAQPLQARNVFHRLMTASVPGHSPNIDKFRDELLDGLSGLRPQSGAVPFFSTVSCAFVDGSRLDNEYWYENLRRPVLFWDAVRCLIDQHDADAFVEVSAHPLLISSIEQGFEQANRPGLAVASMHRDEPEDAALIESLGALHANGFAVPLERVVGARRVVSLPGYAWQHERFALPPIEPGASPAATAPEMIPANEPDEPAGPDLPADPIRLRALVFDFVLTAVAEVLAFDAGRLDPEAGFFQLGMDSIMAVRTRKRLEKRFRLTLVTPAMFEHPTVNALTDYLVGLMSEQADGPQRDEMADADAMAHLSDDELLAVLASEIRAMEGA
ncbi:MAG TPA: beta-ketoacyl synthase N-terminal-like domain-containing protein [Candidatus Limnocylindrales bacterium]|nr:beta-ketoacyl synthase N-terminal-like domain-containing protein [Candidatus Limnocylindrales bacterium]